MGIPVIVNCRDRLEPLVRLLAYLERAGQDRIVLLDNDSAYPPLLDYLASTPHRVLRLGRNGGRLAPWADDVFAELGIVGRFVFTDPDIVPDEDCPGDAIEYFGEILDRYPDIAKAGFGLKIDDLPDMYRFNREVVAWESQFWERTLAPRLYDAQIDTTFALYRSPAPHDFGPAVRTGYPYLARHVPWYYDDRALPDDEAFYRRRAEGDDINNWGRDALPHALAEAIAARTPLSGSGDSRLSLGDADYLRGHDLLGASGWASEPPSTDEVENTPWTEPGWHSWNNMSAEVELCDFLVGLVIVLRPRRLIETGTGQGFLTRRLKAALRGDQRLMCFESDTAWREALRTLPFFDGERAVLSAHESPSHEELALSNVTCLDSDFPHRLSEIEHWWQAAREGAVVFVHDAGNGHSPDTPNAEVRATIGRLGIPGVFLANPRGAFVGIKPTAGTTRPEEDLEARLAAAERELNALHQTKTFRYTSLARTAYRSLRHISD